MAAERTFPGRPQSVPEARRFLRAVLAEIGADGVTDDALALVSELATNAVLHAHTDFTVSVRPLDRSVRICVQDGSPAAPRPRSYGLDATTGRGMRLVLALAQDWGVDRESNGKVVWVDLPVAGSQARGPHERDDSDVTTSLDRFQDPYDGGGRTDPVARAA